MPPSVYRSDRHRVAIRPILRAKSQPSFRRLNSSRQEFARGCCSAARAGCEVLTLRQLNHGILPQTSWRGENVRNRRLSLDLARLAMGRLHRRPRSCDRARGREPPPARAEPASDRRAQPHVAGPVHVRRRGAPPARQPAVHGDVWLFVRDREARLHVARRARSSGGARHADRQCGGLPDKAAHHPASGQSHQQPGELRQGPDDLGHQPADARRRLGRPTRTSPSSAALEKERDAMAATANSAAPRSRRRSPRSAAR